MAVDSSNKIARATSEGAPQAAAGTSQRTDWCDSQVLDEAVEGLSSCAGDALSKAICRGIVDPDEVVAWTDRTERLIRFQFDRAELRLQIPAVAEQLHALLEQVALPATVSAGELTTRFVASLVRLRKAISLDVEAAFDGDPAASGYEEIAVAYPAIRALSIHRIAHELCLYGVPLIPRIMSEYAHDRTGIDINPGARIGQRFFIDHGTGVVIGETCEIGNNVRLYQGVTLGASSLRDSRALRGVKRHPTVEDDVTIYAGAKILGGETVIGAGSVIGGNVWLTASVAPGSRVMAEPPRNAVSAGREQGDQLALQMPWDD